MTTTTEFQLVDINKLVPYANNARTHNKEQILKLRSSLREFGFVNPVIIDKEYNVLAGHGRIEAAKEEGIAEVPCVYADHLTEAQKKAYILADNRMALDAGWDDELLSVEMQELQELGFDLGLTGFDESEIADLFDINSDEAKQDDFDVDAELEKPCKSKTGDIWHLGKHTVICGDSTLPETYTALQAFMCFMPPPRHVYFMMLMKMQASRSVQDLSGRKTALFSPELTGSISMNRLSGAGEKTESISGMVTRNRKRYLNLTALKTAKRTAADIRPVNRCR